jgi:acyl-CoA thioester hydrolase
MQTGIINHRLVIIKNMQPFTSKIRVSYSDTDQMGFVHHSNYLKYYETGRWNLFRHLGIPYKKIEEEGFLLPVVDVQIQYHKPAFYDEVLTIETSLIAFKGPKLIVGYQLSNEEQELINSARITLAFINTQSRKPCKPPMALLQLWKEHLQKDLQTA